MHQCNFIYQRQKSTVTSARTLTKPRRSERLFFLRFVKSVHHRTIQINHQPDATIFHFIILTLIYSSTCFGRSPARRQELNDCSGSLWFYLRIVVTVVLCSWSGRPSRPRTQHDCHHDTKVKPEADTAVIELLMMGGETPETCWAINKRQDNKLKNCCMWLVIYLNCTMMHGLTDLKNMLTHWGRGHLNCLNARSLGF